MEPLVTQGDVKGRVLLDLVRQVDERIKEVREIESSYYSKPKAVVRRGESFWLDTEPWEGIPASEVMEQAGGRLDPVAASGIMMALLSVMAAFHESGATLGAAAPDCVVVSSSMAGGTGEGKAGPPRCRVSDPKIHHLLAPYRGITSRENNYMPPEVIQGQSWSQQQDIFAAGVTFYYLLTGILPFDDREPSLVADNILHKEPQDPRVYNPTVSERLASLILRMLSKSPEVRPRSARELMVEFNEIAASGSLEASSEEIEAFKHKASQARAKENVFKVRRFLRYRWGLIAGIAAVLILGVFLFQKQPVKPTVTAATSPEEVVSLYYRAIDDLNVQLLDEVIDPKAGANVTRWVTNLYVISKVSMAMSMQAPKGPTPGEAIPPAAAPQAADARQNGPVTGSSEADTDIVKIRDLTITKLASDDESPRFRANYLLTLPSEQGEVTSPCEDILTLSRVEGKWRITQLAESRPRGAQP